LKDSSTLLDEAFSHYLAHICEKTDRIFIKILLETLHRKSPLSFILDVIRIGTPDLNRIRLGEGQSAPSASFQPVIRRLWATRVL